MQTNQLPRFPEMVQIYDENWDKIFLLGKYPVTNEQYNEYLISTGKPPKEPLTQTNLPVVHVSFQSALDYCEWLTEQTEDYYRLPFGDEWQQACANHKQPFPKISVYAQTNLAPVGTKSPNIFGLHDMLGNIWEWTQTRLQEDSLLRGARGGSWATAEEDFICPDFQYHLLPCSRYPDLGFRVLSEKRKIK